MGSMKLQMEFITCSFVPSFCWKDQVHTPVHMAKFGENWSRICWETIPTSGTTTPAGTAMLLCLDWEKEVTRHGYEAWGYEAEAKPKLWLDHEAEAEALTFWNHEAEAEAEALPFLNHEAEAESEAQVFGSY